MIYWLLPDHVPAANFPSSFKVPLSNSSLKWSNSMVIRSSFSPPPSIPVLSLKVTTSCNFIFFLQYKAYTFNYWSFFKRRILPPRQHRFLANDWQVLGHQVSCWPVLVSGKRCWEDIGPNNCPKNSDGLASQWLKALNCHWATSLLHQLELSENDWWEM